MNLKNQSSSIYLWSLFTRTLVVSHINKCPKTCVVCIGDYLNAVLLASSFLSVAMEMNPLVLSET